MKNKKGFTLVELLAVIVVLSVILVIATTNVMQSINDSRKKAKYIAAKEIVEIGSAYMYENNISDCVKVIDLIENGYLEEAVTNPNTGENGGIGGKQRVCKNTENLSHTAENPYNLIESSEANYYCFDDYCYKMIK